MTKFECGYIGKDGKGHKFTFKSEHRLQHYNGWQGVPIWSDLCAAKDRIEAREGSIMNRVGFAEAKYIKNLSTGYIQTV